MIDHSWMDEPMDQLNRIKNACSKNLFSVTKQGSGVVMQVIPAIWPENSQKVKPYQWTDRQING